MIAASFVQPTLGDDIIVDGVTGVDRIGDTDGTTDCEWNPQALVVSVKHRAQARDLVLFIFVVSFVGVSKDQLKNL